MSLGSRGFNRVHALRKIQLDFVAQTFALIAQVSAILHRVSCSTKWPQMHPTLRNATKHEFSVHWGGWGAFFANNSDMTSWHELLH